MDTQTWEFSYPATKAFERRLWKRTWWRSGGRRALAILAVFLGMNFLITLGWDPEEPSHVVTFVWAVFGTSVLNTFVGYREIVRVADRVFEALRIPTLHYRFDERSVRVASDLSAVDINWHGVVDIWRYRDMWLLAVKPVGAIAVPAEYLSDELCAAIERWMAASRPAGRPAMRTAQVSGGQ